MSEATLTRLLNPQRIALIGAGSWTDAVAQGARTLGYRGELWRIHPQRESTAANRYYRSIDELPGAPDCSFLAVPNHEVPAQAAALARRGAGAFVCFSAGFSETATPEGLALTQQLELAAGTLPFLGPNCYGMVNYFDRVALWPDQVVGTPLERGVALICQSGTIALTLMFNDRSLPIGYLITVGNQTRIAAEDLIDELCDDPRVSAFGLYLEGIKDIRRFASAAQRARACGKPIALIKSGRSEAAMRTARSHTGALTGSDAAFDAFCRQAGIARCETLSVLCETLKLLHLGGPLAGRRVIVMGASGGDMAMAADLSRPLALEYPAFAPESAQRLDTLLTGRVTIGNPFDMHTYLWFDHAAMRSLFAEVLRSDVDAVAFMLDCPPAGRADDAAFTAVIDEFIAAAAGAKARAVLLASLPENLGQAIRERCLAAGVVPLQGLHEGLLALDHAGAMGAARGADELPLFHQRQRTEGPVYTLSEHAAKAALHAVGVLVPQSRLVAANDAPEAAQALGFPVAMKATGAGMEHKSELGGVVIGIRSPAEARSAATRLARLSPQLLVETMIADGVAEVLVGISSDEQYGQILVIGAGGIYTELWRDTVSLLPPWSHARIAAALRPLLITRLINGYRGKPAGDLEALIEAIVAIGRYAEEHCATLIEMDVNPIIVRPLGAGAIAVDALIRTTEES